ncbi:MAG: DNA topoisomerase I [Nanoarchaeota archaeon]
MAYELIITEKPQASLKIASFLANGKPIKKNINGVPYYEITHSNKDIVVASAVGHLYTVAEIKKGWNYPSFDVKWVASSKVNKASAFTSKYVTALKKLAKDANEITVATDFDIEGEVIGYNVVKHICKKDNANRMKFSTLTKDEIINAYKNKMNHLVWGQVNAGLTRHELDWYYGINLSRALTSAVKKAGSFKILSSGRVQGPALKMLCDKEKEISDFKPVPYFEIELIGNLKENEIIAFHELDKIFDEKKAFEIIEKTKNNDGFVSDVNKSSFKQQPPFPFDLTTLQTEAYRTLKIPPKNTLEIAQELYIAGVISYPRTSSQQLPKEIGFSKILSLLSNNPNYKELAKKLLSKKTLNPNNGKKTDPAHPAIYPTGNVDDLDGRKAKLYDLIVRRFLATFAEPAIRETVKISIDVNSEKFISKGTRTTFKGWHEFYAHFVKMEEQTMPSCSVKDFIKVKKIKKHDKETQPPKRYTPASIIKELEKRNLGTKSTRATIIDNLFSRGYVNDKSITVTDLGFKTCNTLEKYSPTILDEQLTREFEEEMENIRSKETKKEKVLEKAKKILTETLTDFKKKEKEIGNDLKQANIESINAQATIGDCPNCEDGKIMIKKSKFGRFLACNKYPDCKTTFNIPNKGNLKSTDKVCEKCNYSLISIQQPRKAPQQFCINPNCSSKTNGENGEDTKSNYPEENMTCPVCNKGKMVLRKGFYGEFLGCNNYPKCKTMMKIVNGKVDTNPITKK